MLVSYKWLQEYLDLNAISPSDLADRITLTGIEVDSIRLPEDYPHVVVGEVISCQSVEGSDHLSKTQVSIGTDAPLQIVCGAPNVQEGIKVVVATVGAVLPGDVTIQTTMICDTRSEGILCALDELGIKDSVVPKKDKGILILPSDAIVGDSVAPYLGLDDTIIELGVTPNRSDALSMRGVAYEVGAILDQQPVFKQCLPLQSDHSLSDNLDVSVESVEDTPYYSLQIIEGVTVGPSPMWLQTKLMNAGIRPVDVIVDVTNYTMMEYGQPLHAFDYDCLPGQSVAVRRATKGEHLETLDGVERQLTPAHLVVTSDHTPVALAGVMGGKSSEVTPNTTTVALEAALFNPTVIRQTAQHFNLRSEASSRFEKGLNTAALTEAADFATRLIVELAGGRLVSERLETGTLNTDTIPVSITRQRLEHVLGTVFKAETVADIWRRLGFEFFVSDDDYTVMIPPRRPDIRISADLVEEVARVYGYHRLPSTLPETESVPGQLTDMQHMKRSITRFLEHAGMQQAISYALTTPDKAKRFKLVDDTSLVTLAYPMSQEHRALRQNITSGLLDNVAYNHARQMDTIQLFELGRVFHRQSDGAITESDQVGMVLTGEHSKGSWYTTARPIDFFVLKGIIEELLSVLGVDDEVRFNPITSDAALHPGRAAHIYIHNQLIGLIGQVHPTLAQDLGIKDTYVAEFTLSDLQKLTTTKAKYQSLSKYPATSRDMAVLVDQSVTHQAIMDVIETHSDERLVAVDLFDMYAGDGIENGKKSVAYSLTYQDAHTSLTDETVDKLFNTVKEALIADLNAEIR